MVPPLPSYWWLVLRTTLSVPFIDAYCYHDTMTKKVTTVRMSDDLAATVEMAARTEGVSVNTFIIESVAERIDKVRHDAEFMARVKMLVERDKDILDRLAQ